MLIPGSYIPIQLINNLPIQISSSLECFCKQMKPLLERHICPDQQCPFFIHNHCESRLDQIIVLSSCPCCVIKYYIKLPILAITSLLRYCVFSSIIHSYQFYNNSLVAQHLDQLTCWFYHLILLGKPVIVSSTIILHCGLGVTPPFFGGCVEETPTNILSPTTLLLT
jgi:hypothetical protein